MNGSGEQLIATTGALELAGFTSIHAVASGGDSTIYRATQTALDREVAIKVVSLSAAQEVRRFEREIALTVKLGRAHPNIVTVLDTRTLTDGRPCIVMDFFELGSTHDRLRSTGVFLPADVISMGRVIADALAFAHDQRVVHRDVKPQNILILPTSYVLADFGIARSVDAGHTSSLDRLSYRHASPEVLDGRPPEPVDDLWALCSTMATLLEGRAPFAADDPADDTALAYLRRVRTAQRRGLPVELPGGLRELIDKGMDPERSRRFSSAAELMAGLRDLDRGTTSWAPGPGAGAPLAPPVPFRIPPTRSNPVATAAPTGDSGPPQPRVPAADAPITGRPDQEMSQPGGSRHAAQEPGPAPTRAAVPPVVATTTAAPIHAAATPAVPDGVGDLPAGSDDLGWAPTVSSGRTSAAARTHATDARGFDSASPTVPVPDGPVPDGLVPDGPVPHGPVPEFAAPPGVMGSVAALPPLVSSAGTGGSSDRDGDARISAGHTRPTATDADAPAVSVAAHLSGDRGSAADSSAMQPDAAPTGWRPSADTATADTATAVTATAVTTDQNPPGARVRAGIIALAVVMLLISGTVAYFIARPSTRSLTPVTETPVNVGATSAVSQISGGNIAQNDPDYTPTILSVKFVGDDLIKVVVRGPDAESANLMLFDATGFDEQTRRGSLRPLIQTYQPKASQGDTTLSATVSFTAYQNVKLAVIANDGGRKAGLDFHDIRAPGACSTSSS